MRNHKQTNLPSYVTYCTRLSPYLSRIAPRELLHSSIALRFFRQLIKVVPPSFFHILKLFGDDGIQAGQGNQQIGFNTPKRQSLVFRKFNKSCHGEFHS